LDTELEWVLALVEILILRLDRDEDKEAHQAHLVQALVTKQRVASERPDQGLGYSTH
jgi:hypothetical protein